MATSRSPKTFIFRVIGDEESQKETLLAAFEAGIDRESHEYWGEMTAGQTDRERDLEYQAITMDIGAVPPYLFEKHPQEENEVVRDIICFSVLSRSSFEAIEIRRVIWERRKLLYPTLLVALDTDYRWDAEAFHREHSERSSSGPVLTHEGERLAYDLGAFAYLECSSRNPSEVKKVFQEACKFVSRPDRKGGCLVQ